MNKQIDTKLIAEKARNIKALFLDVDGVFTDGSFYLSPQGEELKRFHTHDGLGLKHLQQQGLFLAIISGRQSEAVTQRMQELKIFHVYQNVSCKLTVYETLIQELQLNDAAVAYMGDDLPDLPVLARAGLSIAPANAVKAVREKVDWVTEREGGNAAIREVCDFISYQKNPLYAK